MVDNMLSKLPDIVLFNNIKKIPKIINYIGCAGFEDRSMSTLDYLISKEIKIKNAIGIKYKPLNRKNKVKEFSQRLEILEAEINWIFYNRYEQKSFENIFINLFNWNDIENLIIDISGMSKFLIMIILKHLIKLMNFNFIISYAEAQIYHPTYNEFIIELEKVRKSPPVFLTSNVYKIMTSPTLSSVSMQGYPILLIAYPTFNYLELITLYNEMSPQKLIILEGNPLNEKDKWRLKGIRKVNREFIENSEINLESIVISTFNYIETFNTLKNIYKKYRYTHKIILAPTGSKLQTIASLLFHYYYPEIQIIYPITKSFIGEYSEKCRCLWGIDFRTN